MSTQKIVPEKPVNNSGGVVGLAAGPQPIGVVQPAKLPPDTVVFKEVVGVQKNNEPPMSGDGSGHDPNAPAYRIGNLLSLANAGKWRGHVFAGMVVPRSALEQPGVDIMRLLRLGAVFPATLDELAAYERQYGEPQAQVEKRAADLKALRKSLNARVKRARKNSQRVDLLTALIREWSAIESECRRRWSGDFGCLIGKTEEEIRRYTLAKEYDLRTLGAKDDVYRETMKAVGEPLLIAAAGLPGVDTAPLHDFLESTAMQFNERNPVEWTVLQWLPPLRYKLLYQEKQGKPFYRRLSSFVVEQWWKLLLAVLTAAVVGYMKAKGVLK